MNLNNVFIEADKAGIGVAELYNVSRLNVKEYLALEGPAGGDLSVGQRSDVQIGITPLGGGAGQVNVVRDGLLAMISDLDPVRIKAEFLSISDRGRLEGGGEIHAPVTNLGEIDIHLDFESPTMSGRINNYYLDVFGDFTQKSSGVLELDFLTNEAQQSGLIPLQLYNGITRLDGSLIVNLFDRATLSSDDDNTRHTLITHGVRQGQFRRVNGQTRDTGIPLWRRSGGRVRGWFFDLDYTSASVDMILKDSQMRYPMAATGSNQNPAVWQPKIRLSQQTLVPSDGGIVTLDGDSAIALDTTLESRVIGGQIVQVADFVTLVMPISLDETADSLRFNFEFLTLDAGGRGILGTYVDDQLVFKAYENDALGSIFEGAADTFDIPLGRVLEPGIHTLEFRLSPWEWRIDIFPPPDDMRSVVRISDIQFGSASSSQSALGLAGDYNGDGIVDATDYTVWLDNLGNPAGLQNDNNLGVVGQLHYDLWKANFGMSAGSGSAGGASVPEPAAGLLLMLGVAATLFRRSAFVS